MARHIPAYRNKGIDLMHQIHDAFVLFGRGVVQARCSIVHAAGRS
jgi:hypothetical protein